MFEKWKDNDLVALAIASAYRTEYPGFDSRQGVGKVFRSLYIAVLLS
jgi:hypothetical protein